MTIWAGHAGNVGDKKFITKSVAEESERMTQLGRPRHRRNIRVEGEEESAGLETASCEHGYEYQGFKNVENI